MMYELKWGNRVDKLYTTFGPGFVLNILLTWVGTWVKLIFLRVKSHYQLVPAANPFFSSFRFAVTVLQHARYKSGTIRATEFVVHKSPNLSSYRLYILNKIKNPMSLYEYRNFFISFTVAHNPLSVTSHCSHVRKYSTETVQSQEFRVLLETRHWPEELRMERQGQKGYR